VNPNLTNLVSWLPAAQRYSYVFDGNAQVLDHALVNVALLPWISRFGYTRSNADFPDTARNDATRPERLSDHDASVTYLAIGTPKLSGRIVSQTPSPGGGQIVMALQIANLGGGNARGVVVDQVLLRTLAGIGTVTLATALPMVATSRPGNHHCPADIERPGWRDPVLGHGEWRLRRCRRGQLPLLDGAADRAIVPMKLMVDAKSGICHEGTKKNPCHDE
jgi:hypothetical protein